MLSVENTDFQVILVKKEQYQICGKTKKSRVLRKFSQMFEGALWVGNSIKCRKKGKSKALFFKIISKAFILLAIS